LHAKGLDSSFQGFCNATQVYQRDQDQSQIPDVSERPGSITDLSFKCLGALETKFVVIRCEKMSIFCIITQSHSEYFLYITIQWIYWYNLYSNMHLLYSRKVPFQHASSLKCETDYHERINVHKYPFTLVIKVSFQHASGLKC